MSIDPNRLVNEVIAYEAHEAEDISALLRRSYPVERVAKITRRESAFLFRNGQSLVYSRAIQGDHFVSRDWPGYPEIKKDYGKIDETAFSDDMPILHSAVRRLDFSQAFSEWLEAQGRAFWENCGRQRWFGDAYSYYARCATGLRYEFAAKVLDEFFLRLWRQTKINFMPPRLDYQDFDGSISGSYYSNEEMIRLKISYKNPDSFHDMLDTLSHEMTHSAIDQMGKLPIDPMRYPFPDDVELAQIKRDTGVTAFSVLSSTYFDDPEETLCRRQSDILIETLQPRFGFNAGAAAEDRVDHDFKSGRKAKAIRYMLHGMPWEKKWRDEDGRTDEEPPDPGQFVKKLTRPLGFLPPDKR